VSPILQLPSQLGKIAYKTLPLKVSQHAMTH
jgi:hypothetical protein